VNAADRKLVKNQSAISRRRDEEVAAAVKAQMSTVGGRLVMWQLLSIAGIYQSVFDTQTTRMAALAGRQDYGHELQAMLLRVDEEAYELMEREARLRARQDAAELLTAEHDAETRALGRE